MSTAPSGTNAGRPTTVYPSATIGRVAQTDECNAHRHEAQFDCSYSGDKAEFILELSALSYQLSAKPGVWILKLTLISLAAS
jgi:hypothetical protein